MLAENVDVLEQAAAAARRHGYVTWVDFVDNEDPIEETVIRLMAEIIDLKRKNPISPVCIISGGEVSCPVRGAGFGGRNQEFALRCAAKLGECGVEAFVLSCGTDGIDGKSVAAGANARSSRIVASGNPAPIEPYLAGSDSASFFSEFGGAIVTGPSGNNLRDLRILLAR